MEISARAKLNFDFIVAQTKLAIPDLSGSEISVNAVNNSIPADPARKVPVPFPQTRGSTCEVFVYLAHFC
jgi:hypothetical protein